MRSINRSFKRTPGVLVAALIAIYAGGCRPDAPATLVGSDPVVSPQPGTPVFTYKVVNAWPHDRRAFTQGLVYDAGALLESTGLYGRSSLRRVELDTGLVLQRIAVPPEYFAEGLAALDGKLYQLSWRNQKGFVYDQRTFRLEKEFSYDGEGWGLATDGQSLILSDRTDRNR